MANLAIKGHATRGKEVIELLEMLGGINKYNLRGNEDEWFVLNGTLIQRSDRLFAEKGFPLEQFLEKFPYKVGDKVSSKYLKNYKIAKMEWEDTNNRVIYKLQGMGWYSAGELQPYKEETMEEKGTLTQIDLTRELCVADEVEVILGDYEFVLKEGKTYFVKKKPKYPKTYEESAAYLETINSSNPIITASSIGIPIMTFGKLIVCRNAYWKIAGEQMGLGKPWEPDFLNPAKETRYFLFCTGTTIENGQALFPTNKILIFPTEEMQDAFHENFKELIEECKEFL